MKILLGNDTYPPDVNGAAYFTRRLAEGLAQRDHEVHVLCASRGFRTEVVRRGEVVEHRMRSAPIPLHTGFRFSPPPFLYRRVLSEMERVWPDIVHVQGHFPIGRALIHAAREIGIPVGPLPLPPGQRRRRLQAKVRDTRAAGILIRGQARRREARGRADPGSAARKEVGGRAARDRGRRA